MPDLRTAIMSGLLRPSSMDPTSPRPTSTPICRLPAETLIDMFSVHSPTFVLSFYDPTLIYLTQLEHLANVRLLTLSQVCSQWHSLIIGNPTFWTSIFHLAPAWDTPSRLETIFQLLKSVLERGRDSPITFMIYKNHAVPPPTWIFYLLTQHSHRWYSVDFLCVIYPFCRADRPFCKNWRSVPATAWLPTNRISRTAHCFCIHSSSALHVLNFPPSLYIAC
jgi:hypothetical protein